jgi:hypothetical protein
VEIIKVDAKEWHVGEIRTVGNPAKENERWKIQK